MPVSCCIVGCPTIVSANHVNRLIDFPAKDSPEYPIWREACKESEAHIDKLRKPLVCPLHFQTNGKTNIKQTKGTPCLFVQADDLQKLNQQWQSINRLVSEWLSLSQENNPELVINGIMLKAKAMEVANILKINQFDVNFGWLHSFEVFLNLNGIKHSWKERKGPKSSTVIVQSVIESDPEVTNVELVVHEKLTEELYTDEAIKTYEEALEKVKLLEEYVKKTQNKNAVELCLHMKEILANTSD